MKRFLIIICCLLFVSYSVAQTSKVDKTVHNNETYDVTTDETFENVTIESDGVLTVKSGATLTVTGTLISPYVTCLIIEEGGQLINKSSEVKATVKKTIQKYSESGWYTISSPINNMDVANSDFIPVEAEYEHISLFWFKEKSKNKEWQNYFASSWSVFNRGYLYANDCELESRDFCFKGVLNWDNINIDDVTFSEKQEETMRGFNLVGNPYPHDIYKGKGTAIPNEKVVSGYYTLDGGDRWITHNHDDAIKPGQGIMIKLTGSLDDDILSIQNLTNSESSKNDSGFLMINVMGENDSDRTFVYFDEGVGLDKLEHLSDMASSLSVRDHNKKYAIAHVGEFCNLVDVVFGNTQQGWFTLNVDNSKSNINYLHLIDNITGEEIDLLQEQSYKFYAFGNESENRFTLVMNPITNSIENNVFAYLSNGDIIITGLENTARLQVFDIMGRMIGSDVISKVEGVACRVSKPDVAGVYVLRLISDNGIKTQKIVIE